MAKLPRWFKIPLLMLLGAILAVLTVGFVSRLNAYVTADSSQNSYAVFDATISHSTR